jgi:hypothetical protein
MWEPNYLFRVGEAGNPLSRAPKVSASYSTSIPESTRKNLSARRDIAKNRGRELDEPFAARQKSLRPNGMPQRDFSRAPLLAQNLNLLQEEDRCIRHSSRSATIGSSSAARRAGM